MKNFKYILILAILSYFFLMFGNGILSLSNPDEVFYAQTAKEMVGHRTWMTPYLFGQPQFEKPILTYWLLRVAFIIFGTTSFSARFFPALFAMIGVIAIYFLGLLGFKDGKKAFLSALILMSGGLYIGLARTLFTDLIFSIFILLALLSFFWGYSLEKYKGTGLIFFFIFSGLAVLTKGPLGLSIPVLAVVLFLLLRKDLRFLLNKYSVVGFIIFLFIALPWYILMIKKYGSSFIYEFFYNDHLRRILEAEHTGNDTWYFYPMSMAGCMFPWSLFVVASLFYLPKYLKQKENTLFVFLASWIIACFITFQLAHSKLTSYIFPLFPALAIIASYFIYEQTAKNKRIILIISFLNIFFLFLILSGLIFGLAGYRELITQYLHSKLPIFLLIAGFSALIILILKFIRQQRLLRAVYCFALIIPLMLSIVPLIKNDIEPYLSSQEASRYLLKNYDVNNMILCSKPYVRGVHYYTDKEVACTSIPGMPFFSPHPIPFINTDEKAQDFLHKQSTTYCVLKKSSVEDMERIAKEKGFEYRVLKVIGNQYILKIEPFPETSK